MGVLPIVVAALSVLGVGAFDVKQHLGNLSPFFTPSSKLVGGLGTGMPDGCSLEQVQLVRFRFACTTLT